MRKETVSLYDQVLFQAESALCDKERHESEAVCLASSDPVVRQGWILKQKVEREFRGLHAGKTDERILIQVPPPAYSPAGYSLFNNLIESLEFIGVPTRKLDWDGETERILTDFGPTVLLSSDHQDYLSRIDWEAVRRYKQGSRLRVGLTASLEEYGNTPLQERLAWSARHEVDFYYTFRDEGYVMTRRAYRHFFEAGYKMIYVPFGANILHYYPVAGFERDLDYVLMATRKSEHMSFMKGIVGNYVGFIDGPGWRHVKNFRFNRDRDRYIYARAKVGLNVHLPEQIEWACEVNERTFQLAACGVPQLVDRPKLIDKIFSSDALFVVDSPADYVQNFRDIMAHPEMATQRALLAQKEAFTRHTTFHRADAFIRQLAWV
ncbi:MAG: glycosyltransferase [Hylemonella sp.]